jgi:nucleoside-diphosphate kinase
MDPEYPTYVFRLEYFDERAELVRPYLLLFYTELGEIEIRDLKNHRQFLKRTVEHSIRLTDLYPGSKIVILARPYDVVDYSDTFTRNSFDLIQEHTYAMLKPGFYQHLGDALDRISSEGLFVANLRLGCVSRQTAAEFYAEHQGKSFYETLVSYITSGPIVALEVVGPHAIRKWRQIIGPTNLEVAKRDAPQSLRARFARSTTENFAHGSDAPGSAAREIGIIFGGRRVALLSSINETALCIVKPHALRAKLAGKIIKQIVDAGFQITGAATFAVDLAQATEFYEVYRGVVPEFVEMTQELSTSPCLAIEVAKPGDNVVVKLRKVCGPRDVPVAKAIAPQSIRAKYGVDLVHNAVHCTDLVANAQLECEYFFTLLEAARSE